MPKVHLLTNAEMNDPQVVALVYRIKHGEQIDYSRARPFQQEEPTFRLSVKDGLVRFEFTEHYPTIGAAENAIDAYISAWEFDAQLRRGPDSFRLALDRTKSELIDRNPGTGAGHSRFPAGTAEGSFDVNLITCPAEYPKPAPGLAVNLDAVRMHRRFMAYRRGSDTLPAVANFCVTVLEGPVGQKDKRKKASGKYGIDREVLDKVACLADAKGGPDEARKSKGIDHPLSAAERKFLEAALKAVIRRTAELENAPVEGLPKIRMSNLPAFAGARITRKG